MSSIKVAIVGAGIMGRVLAFYLATTTNFEIHLFDDGKKSASSCAAGMIAPFTELDRADVWLLEMGLHSLQLWPLLLAALSNAVFYAHMGCVLMAHPQDFPLLEFQIEKIWQKSKIKPTSDDHFANGYFFKDEAQIDAKQVLIALQQFLLPRIQWHQCTVVEIQEHRVLCREGFQQVDWIIDCRGLGARLFFPELRSVRGELISLHITDMQLPCPVRLVHPRYSIYLVPRPTGHVIVGATELETSEAGPITAQALLELISAAVSVDKRFLTANLVESVVGHRPTLPHHQPRIKVLGNTLAVNGLHRHGYCVAPALAQEILNYLRGAKCRYPTLWETEYDYSCAER